MSEVPPFEVVTYEVADHVATLTLNRPDRRNALSAQLVNELIVALETAGADPDVGAIVLTGAGGVFCSGGDLSQMTGAPGKPAGVPFRGGFVELNLAFTTVGKPVIAKVRRYALAGGLGLVCACHFAIAEDTATFGLPEIKRGLWPMMIMAAIFRTVPRRRGLELCLLGERVDAVEAAAIGLINEAVPPEELDAAVDALAQRLAQAPPQVVALGLEAFYAQDTMRYEQALPYLEQQLGSVLSTDDAKEGLTAFLTKRPPRWRH